MFIINDQQQTGTHFTPGRVPVWLINKLSCTCLTDSKNKRTHKNKKRVENSLPDFAINISSRSIELSD